MFRRLLPITLLGLIVLQLVGFNFYFYNEKAKIKKQLKTYLKEGVSSQQLRTFEFTENQLAHLRWTKENKEFKLGERYYDIVWKKELKNHMIRFQCVDDVQESRLFKRLAAYLNKNLGDQGDQSLLGTVFNLLNAPAVLNEIAFYYQPKEVDKEQLRISFYFQLLIEGHYSIVIPPPNIC